MRVRYKEYIIDIIDDSNYILNSSDNIVSYDKEYFDRMIDTDRIISTSKQGIRIDRNGEDIASAIICEIGGATIIHDKSALVADDSLLICCCDKVYSLSIPKLEIKWKKRFDPATCFAIYPFKEDFIIHGELQVTRIDMNGHEKWNFGARDILVTPDGQESFKLIDDKIKLRDWGGYEYILDEHGQEIR